MEKNKQPGISFNSILLVKEEFQRKHFLPEKLNVDVKFKTKRTIEDGDNINGIIEIETTVKFSDQDKNEYARLVTVFVGQFSIIKSEKNMGMEHFLKNNAPALLFPYIREHISSITSRAGIPPVILPPMNITAMLKKEEG